MFRRAVVVLASVLSLIACSGGKDMGGSFDPNGYDRSCSLDADCELVSPVNDCHMCCGNDVALRRSSGAREARSAVLAQCYSTSACAMDCMTVAVCVDGTCVKRTASEVDASAAEGP
jgi:hypothetical protein